MGETPIGELLQAKETSLGDIMKRYAVEIKKRRDHHFDALAAAFMQETGASLQDIVLCEQQDGLTTRWFFRTKDSFKKGSK